MSSRIFQGVIVQMKDATTRCIGVVDEQGFVIACSELSMIGSRLDDFQAAVGEVQEQLFATDARTYKILSASTARFEYAVFVEGNDQTARSICILAAVGMTEASTNFEEKHNKAAFVKNIISDNILPGDVYVRAKELHFTTDVPRAVLLVRQVNVTDIAVLELIQNMFPDRQHDFVLSVSESDIVVIKEMTPDETSEDVCALAESIERAEDRELFKELCESIGEPIVPSQITYSIEEGLEAAEKIGYPVILRPAFTLGGTGGGFAYDPDEMRDMMKNALALSPVHQVLVEKSIKGYKEIEYEVIRDANDTAITVCNMENLDPVGIHTGDSIVVAPSQTLTNKEYQMLRDSALKIIRALGVKGGCNVQFALVRPRFKGERISDSACLGENSGRHGSA